MTFLGYIWAVLTGTIIGLCGGLFAGRVLWNLDTRKREVIE